MTTVVLYIKQINSALDLLYNTVGVTAREGPGNRENQYN